LKGYSAALSLAHREAEAEAVDKKIKAAEAAAKAAPAN
jgi:hypothetical protein